jgi:hypothetical protein
MRWKQYSAHEADTIRSDAGYAILRCTSDGRPTGRYVAFKCHIEGRREVLGGYDSPADARSACEAHHAKRLEVA